MAIFTAPASVEEEGNGAITKDWPAQRGNIIEILEN